MTAKEAQCAIRFQRSSETIHPSSPAAETSADYPTLRNLLGTWLNQDYDTVSTDPDQIIVAYKAEHLASVAQLLTSDIGRYLGRHAGESESDFTKNFEELFHPEVEFEGWKDRTTRQFLMNIRAMLTNATLASRQLT